MRHIRWLGPALVTAVIAATIVANAAPGDPVWIAQTAEVNLTLSQRQGLATWITSVWPGATPATIQELHCARGPVRCRYVDHHTVTAAEFVAAEAADKSLGFVSESGGNVTYRHSTGYLVLSPAQRSSLGTWLATVWPAVGTSAAQGLSVRRQANEGSGDTFPAVLEYLTTGTPAEYATALSAGQVVRRAGTVE